MAPACSGSRFRCALTPEQMETLAALAEEYSDGICHVTTRTDLQLHYIHIETRRPLFRSAPRPLDHHAGNLRQFRPHTHACPRRACAKARFLMSRPSQGVAPYLLGHPTRRISDGSSKSRSAGANRTVRAVSIHDSGWIAATRMIDGRSSVALNLRRRRIGAVPHQANCSKSSCPKEDCSRWPARSGRVFAAIGREEERNKARLKIRGTELGIESSPGRDGRTSSMRTIRAAEIFRRKSQMG